VVKGLRVGYQGPCTVPASRAASAEVLPTALENWKITPGSLRSGWVGGGGEKMGMGEGRMRREVLEWGWMEKGRRGGLFDEGTQ
jgi:hypothetical protein